MQIDISPIQIPPGKEAQFFRALADLFDDQTGPENPVGHFDPIPIAEERVNDMDFQRYKLTLNAPQAKDLTKRQVLLKGTAGDHAFLGGTEGSRTVVTLDSNGEAAFDISLVGDVVTQLGLEEAKTFTGIAKHADNGTPPQEAETVLFTSFAANDATPPDAPSGTVEHEGEETIDVT